MRNYSLIDKEPFNVFPNEAIIVIMSKFTDEINAFCHNKV